MRIGIISDAESFMPLAGALVSQKIQVLLFYSPNADAYINQKVDALAKQFRLPVTTESNKDTDIYNWLWQNKLEVCFIIGYNRLLVLDKLNGLSTKLFNIHFGSLPSFRGPSPVFWQLKKGSDQLGLCIHQLNDKFDSGAIYWMKEIPNLPHYNFKFVSYIFSQLCVEGAFFILQCLFNNIPLVEIKREGQISAYQKRPTLADVSIDWNQMTASEICHLIKACNPWNKGAITFWKKQEIKLMDARVTGGVDEQPGTIISTDDKLQIVSADKKILEVSMLFYMDSYWSAYQLKELGFASGDVFESNLSFI